jgi:ribosomal protein S18 acetylase RimI-like enzyme
MGSSAILFATYASNEPMVTLRRATSDDLAQIEAIDAAAFGDAAGAELASKSELQTGIEDNCTLVACDPRTTAVIGFVQWFVSPEDRLVFLCGMAIEPARQNRGVGSLLLDGFLEIVDGAVDSSDWTLEATTAPSNTRMVALLTEREFVGCRYVPDYYGADKARIYLRRGHARRRYDESTRVLVPATSDGALSHLRSTETHLRKLIRLPHGPHFELVGVSEELVVAQANESSASVAFTGIFFTAVAFLTGFALATDGFPSDLLALLVGSLVVLALSLIVYANSTGALSSLNSGDFDEYMQVGNVLSEFGGVYPFFHVIPVVLVSLTKSDAVGLMTCVGASVVLALYHWSRFEILERYFKRRVIRVPIESYLTLSPLLGFALHQWTGKTTLWSITDLLVLAGLTVACLKIADR